MMSDFNEEAYVYLEPSKTSQSRETSNPKTGVDNIGYENETGGTPQQVDDKDDDSVAHDDNDTSTGDVISTTILDE